MEKKTMYIIGGVLVAGAIGYYLYSRRKTTTQQGAVSAEEAQMLKSMGLDETGESTGSETATTPTTGKKVVSLKPITGLKGKLSGLKEKLQNVYATKSAVINPMRRETTITLSKQLAPTVKVGQAFTANYKSSYGFKMQGTIKRIVSPTQIIANGIIMPSGKNNETGESVTLTSLTIK